MISNISKNLQLYIIFCKINWILHSTIYQCYSLIFIINIDCLCYFKFHKQVNINVEEICSSWKTSFLFQLIIPSVKHLFPRESFVSFSAQAGFYDYIIFFSFYLYWVWERENVTRENYTSLIISKSTLSSKAFHGKLKA